MSNIEYSALYSVYSWPNTVLVRKEKIHRGDLLTLLFV